MRNNTPHPDEHMALYEWCGAGTGGTGFPAPAESKRTHPWHASYGVLAVLTSLLIVSGCGKEAPAETAGEQGGPSVQEFQDKANPLYEEATDKPGAPPESGQVQRNMVKQA